MKNISTINPHFVLLSLASAVLFGLTGCGGSAPENYLAQLEGTQYHQGSQAPSSRMPGPSGTASLPGSTVYRADTSSFTLNPTQQFKGFNPDIWNDSKAWYECDCGNTARGAPKTMPWNPAG